MLLSDRTSPLLNENWQSWEKIDLMVSADKAFEVPTARDKSGIGVSD